MGVASVELGEATPKYYQRLLKGKTVQIQICIRQWRLAGRSKALSESRHRALQTKRDLARGGEEGSEKKKKSPKLRHATTKRMMWRVIYLILILIRVLCQVPPRIDFFRAGWQFGGEKLFL